MSFIPSLDNPFDFYLLGLNSFIGISTSSVLALYITYIFGPLQGVFAHIGLALGQTFITHCVLNSELDVLKTWIKYFPWLCFFNFGTCSLLLRESFKQTKWAGTQSMKFQFANPNAGDRGAQSFMNQPVSFSQQNIFGALCYISIFFVQTLSNPFTLFGNMHVPIYTANFLSYSFLFLGTLMINLAGMGLLLVGIEYIMGKLPFYQYSSVSQVVEMSLKFGVIGLLVFNPGLYPWKQHTFYSNHEDLPEELYQPELIGETKGQGLPLKHAIPDRHINIVLAKRKTVRPWLLTTDLAQSSKFASLRNQKRKFYKLATADIYNVDPENPERSNSPWMSSDMANSRTGYPIWLNKYVRPSFLYPRKGRPVDSNTEFQSEDSAIEFANDYRKKKGMTSPVRTSLEYILKKRKRAPLI